jgi:hypothetical protein
MDSPRSVDIDRLHRDIESTRVSISRMASELRGKAGEAMRWQTYLERFPISILSGAALLGLAVGRRIARGPVPGGVRPSAWSPTATVVDAVVTVPAAIQANGDRFPHVAASWQRLGGRVEGLVNRMIDDVADAVERAVVPVLVGAIQGLFENAGIRATYRPIPPDHLSPPRTGEGGRR